ncbi:MAG: agmatine deiminase family protein [Bacteroidaceae bacterium]|nr:agmatine deiminase family protein [Bacteroidaceae bacterium]
MYLPSEWHQQAFVQMTWPHKDTDWAPVLADAIDCFCAIAREVVKREPLVIVAQYLDEAQTALQRRGIDCQQVTFIPCPTNDTWARDHAFITCIDEQNKKVILNDFQFNGWGLKFAANHDNQINRVAFPAISSLYRQHQIQAEYANQQDFVFEGGSIESDGEGTLMVTSSCLLAENRNNTQNQQDIENRLKQYFHAERVIWISHSWLAGDDTDGHIDTVARFCSPTSIAYVKCDNPADEHYEELLAMEHELQTLRTSDGEPYTLFPLPLPDPCYDDEGNRLPATHANFLIVNGAVLVPTYAQPDKDAEALSQLKKAFPDRDVVGIDCRVLIWQHGSLHCSTMQYPSF